MNVAEVIYEKIKSLPDDKQQEVFDFIDFTNVGLIKFVRAMFPTIRIKCSKQ